MPSGPGAFWARCLLGRLRPGPGASWAGCVLGVVSWNGSLLSRMSPGGVSRVGGHLPGSLPPLLPPKFPFFFTRIDHLIERLGKGSYDKPKDSVKPNNPDVGIILPCEVSGIELVILHP